MAWSVGEYKSKINYSREFIFIDLCSVVKCLDAADADAAATTLRE